ncbi:hypothetical protein EUX98_g8258 [Antrodiella citrinella]|uniref:Uncharacterized protein n=1 Tax=Antrodiella citrinella TaxID=2447956 RepID=A0A4S4MFF6_9APHY|nr:hypothetical protein EUX98_g8258 [Antrodiella citrinella]
MRFLNIATALMLATTVVADFHIFNCWHSYGLGSQTGLESIAVAVPSNQFNCNGIRGNPILKDVQRFVEKGISPFYDPGMCGVGRMDFYSNGNGFDIYNHGGNGQTIGNCVKGGGGKMTCQAAFDEVVCTDDWVCLTNVCS